MAELITIMWRDIPAQVTARSGRRKASVQLTDRFQIAIDRAAVNAGKETTDEYLGEWHRTTAECSDDLEAAVNEAADRLETDYPDTLLRTLAANGGYRPAEDPA